MDTYQLGHATGAFPVLNYSAIHLVFFPSLGPFHYHARRFSFSLLLGPVVAVLPLRGRIPLLRHDWQDRFLLPQYRFRIQILQQVHCDS